MSNLSKTAHIPRSYRRYLGNLHVNFDIGLPAVRSTIFENKWFNYSKNLVQKDKSTKTRLFSRDLFVITTLFHQIETNAGYHRESLTLSSNLDSTNLFNGELISHYVDWIKTNQSKQRLRWTNLISMQSGMRPAPGEGNFNSTHPWRPPSYNKIINRYFCSS